MHRGGTRQQEGVERHNKDEGEVANGFIVNGGRRGKYRDTDSVDDRNQPHPSGTGSKATRGMENRDR